MFVDVKRKWRAPLASRKIAFPFKVVFRPQGDQTLTLQSRAQDSDPLFWLYINILTRVGPNIKCFDHANFLKASSQRTRAHPNLCPKEHIKDAREGSRVRTWDWLFSKLKELIAELREDANETAIKDSLNPPQKHNQPDVPRKTNQCFAVGFLIRVGKGKQ